MLEELEAREPTINYKCQVCNHQKFDEKEMRTSGGGFSAIFEVNTEKFRVISCQRCKAIQLFEAKTSHTSVVLDVLFG